MVDRGLYKKEFEPICQPGEYIETYPTKKFYLVNMVYPQPILSVDLCDATHLAASLATTESAEVEIDDVYVDDGEILHFRVIPRDDFAVTWIAKPKARPLLTTKNKTWELQTVLDDPRTNPAVENLQIHEFFQFEDTEFWIKAKANTATLSAARLIFFGWRLIVKEVASVPTGIRPTRIPTEGYPGTSA